MNLYRIKPSDSQYNKDWPEWMQTAWNYAYNYPGGLQPQRYFDESTNNYIYNTGLLELVGEDREISIVNTGDYLAYDGKITIICPDDLGPWVDCLEHI